MKWSLFCCFLGILGLHGCESKARNVDYVTIPSEEREEEVEIEERDSSLHRALASYQLVDIHELDSTILVDLKYASADNFMKHPLYDTLDRVFLQRDVAERIVRCQQFLRDSFPNYSLLIYDGVRPLEVQREMWKALDSIPPALRGKFVSNPAYGSVHNYGAAVDITICDDRGVPLDMGAGYDDFREIAFPKYEARFLKSGELSMQQLENRKLLRAVMASQGFRNIPSEWWHFNACSRDQAAAKYQKLIYETGDGEQWKQPLSRK